MSSPLFDFFHTDNELSSQLYGDSNIIEVDFTKLYTFDPEYAMQLLEKPIGEIKYLTGYAKATTEMDKEIHIVNLPETTPIHKLKSKQMNALIQTEGTVVQRSKTLMRATKLCFQCKSCGQFETVTQTMQYREYPRDACPTCDGRRWNHIYERSEFVEYQEIVIQELLENTPNGLSSDKIKIELNGSLIRSCEPGEDVKIVGVLSAQDSSSKSMDIKVEIIIKAVSLVNNTEADTVTLTDEDKKHIQQLMGEPDHILKITQSIAPTIYGMDVIKEALAYQQCEGQVKQFKKTRKRGQFHILLAGPPGYGKSELGDFMVLCHPKGRKAIGRGASGVGLTASVVKDGENFVLRAGAMALADNGFLFIDEIEKMSQTDSGAMHPGMEQQEININKADISATLKTRCSILAACNPLGGSWDSYKTIVGNLNDKGRGLPRPLLDRFALIFVIRQNVDDAEEEKVIDHILRVNTEPESLESPYGVDLLRKIFAYARSIKVSITEETSKRLSEFYKVLYDASKRDNTLMITRRQPEDLVRLAEASARLHGRTETTLEDAETSIRMIAKSLQDYGIDPNTGKIDQATALYGEAKTYREMIQDASRLMALILKTNIDTTKVDRREFVQRAVRVWGCNEGDVGRVLETLLKDGTFYCPTPYTIAISPTLLYTKLDTEKGEEP